MMDLTNRRFGRLVVVKVAERPGKRGGRVTWFCDCDCGGSVVTATSYLTSGDTRSCGCITRERCRKMAAHYGASNGRFTHGENTSGISAELRAYKNAFQRCNNPNNNRYADWGGRGIKFLFTSFEEFLKEVGRKPSPKHTIDRINNDGNYEPGNVKWSTKKEQATNKRRPGGSEFRSLTTGRFVKGEK